MKPIKDETLDEMEAVVPACIKAIRAFLAYEGSNTIYLKKAQVSAATLSGYARVRASESNRIGIEHMMTRDRQSLPKRLTAAK